MIVQHEDRNNHVKRSSVWLLQKLPLGSGLYLCYRRLQKYQPLCIWPIMQCSITGGNSFLTPAGNSMELSGVLHLNVKTYGCMGPCPHPDWPPGKVRLQMQLLPADPLYCLGKWVRTPAADGWGSCKMIWRWPKQQCFPDVGEAIAKIITGLICLTEDFYWRKFS